MKPSIPRFRARSSIISSRNSHANSNAAIRNAFDNFQAKSATSSNVGSMVNAGRFKYDTLRKPSDFIALTRRTQLRADAIVHRMLAYTPATLGSNSSSDDDRQRKQQDLLVQVKQIDRLSDLLCGVIDLAELVRNLDPDPQWVGYADNAYQELCYYMNQLNTHVGLYDALKRVYDPVANSASTSSDSHSALFPALTVAAQFLQDFEKSGIHLPDSQRSKFVSLSDEILSLGRIFTTPPSPEETAKDTAKLVPTTYEELSAWDHRLAESSGARRGENVFIHADSAEGQALRREHSNPEIRKKFYEASYKGKGQEERVGVLEELLKKRGELATLVGRKNWGEVALVDKMAKTPENVMSFLTSLATRNRPLAERDLSQLSSAKQAHLSLRTPPSIEAWDRDYYYSLAVNRFAPSSPHPVTLAPYFSVGNCIAGLSSLFQHIYGIHFEIEDTLPGETWLDGIGDGSVQKLAVIDEIEGKIGEIYCDLFQREGKPTGAAHFTVRCSRRLDDDDSHIDLSYMSDSAKREYGNLGEMDGLPLNQERRKLKGRSGEHQLPLVVLTCDFEIPEKGSGRPGLLNWQEVETLFHEMGHAMHSMIGRTDYHNVAGTRCATDLVELPSILMEHFASSSSVLSLFASHYKTSSPLPLNLLRQMQNTLKGFSALESNSQIMMAVLDQRYHSDLPLEEQGKGFDSTEIYQLTQREYGVIQPAKGVAWQTNFGHLFGYGATYYSYLFDRAIASRVFSKLFAADPLSRESGEKYKEELLRHGGGRDPWACVGAVLGEEELMKGDKAAMDAVGSWNVDQ